MDLVLCDDLIKEILQRLPRSSRFSACLVCKSWNSLFHSSATSLTLSVPFSLPSSAAVTLLSSVLSHYPSLSNLTVRFSHRPDDPHPADALFLAVAASPCARRLSYLCFLPDSFLSPSALLSSALSFPHLTSLHIGSLFPLSFRWLSSLPSLKFFSLIRLTHGRLKPQEKWCDAYLAGKLIDDDECANNPAGLVPLLLESFSLTGIPCNDLGLAWLWRRCSNLLSLRLRMWDGDDDHPSPALLSCLPGLLSLELRNSFGIANQILAADHCRSLTSLALHDCKSPNVLLQFIRRRGAGLRTLKLCD